MTGKPLRALIVEDSASDAGLLVREIKRGGYDLYWEQVDDAAGVKAALDKQSWDIVLSDYQMPGFTGTDALGIVKAARRGTPFIFVSGTMGEDLAVAAMRAGAHDYVMKGNLARLVPAIERELQDAEVRRENERAKEALRQNEYSYRTLVENLPQRIYLKDRNSIYISCNGNYAADIGVKPEAVTGKSDFDFYPREQAQKYRDEDRIVMEGGVTTEFEEFFVCHGREHWRQKIKTPFHNPAGECIGILGIYRDITELKETENRILQLNRLKAVLGSVSSAIIHIPEQGALLDEICRIVVEEGHFKLAWIGRGTPDGAVRVVAKAGATSYLDGLQLVTRDEPAGRGPIGTAIRENRIVLVDDAYHDASMAQWCDRLKQHGLRYVAAFPIRVEGEVWGSFQVYATKTNFFNETGVSLVTQVCEEISLALTAIQNATERRRAEAHLRLQISALEAAANAIVITDSKGVIEWANAAFETLTGYSVAEAIGKSQKILKSGKHEAGFYRNLWETILSGNVWEGELINRRKDGILYTEEMTITPIKDNEGEIAHFIAVKQDISARKSLEAQFLRAQRMESIGTLAGGIAHDLNNGLAPILMAVEVLKDHVSEAGGLKLLGLVNASVEHCTALVRQVLTFARGAEGQIVIVNPVYLFDEIEGIVRDTFPKNIEFISGWNRGIWMVNGDPTQLHQAILNLCVNARDAMPEGGALTFTAENVVLDEVYAGTNPDSKPGDYVMVKVADTGTGIDPGIRDRIFEPFFTTKEIGKGTGLGLSTTIGIVKGHGGFIELCSEVGKGTAFKVYLPANTTSKAAANIHAEKPSLPRGNGETILLVDDEERLRVAAQSTLERFGYRVIPASNGAEAVALYAQYRQQIDIVLTDMAMPVMDGNSTILALKTLNPNVRIIGSSGVATAAGATANSMIRHFVPKPYTAQTLLNVLAAALREEP